MKKWQFSSKNDFLFNGLLFFVFLGSLIVILAGLVYSAWSLPFWTDELATVGLIKDISFYHFFTLWPFNTNLPFYYIIQKTIFLHFQLTEFSLRVLSIFSFGITTFFIWKFGELIEKRSSRSLSSFLGLLFLYSHMMFLFGHEARPYALQICFLTLHLYCTYCLFWGGSSIVKSLMGLMILSPCCFMTHYYGTLYIVSSCFLSLFLFHPFFSIERKKVFFYLFAHVLCLIPAFYALKVFIETPLMKRVFWVDSLSLKYVFEQLYVSLTDKGWLGVLILIIPFGILILSYFIKGSKIKRNHTFHLKPFLFFMALLVMMIAVVLIKSSWGVSVFYSRYLAIWVPLYILLIGLSLKLLSENFKKWVILSLTLALVGVHWSSHGTRAFFDVKPINDPRSAIQFSESYIKENPLKAIRINPVLWNTSFYNYYFEQYPLAKSRIKYLVDPFRIRFEPWEKLAKCFPENKEEEVLFVVYEEFFYNWLIETSKKMRYELVSEKNFYGIRVVILKKN